MVKKKAYLFIGLIFLLLIMPLSSAGVFSDLWGKITGYGTSGTTTVNITIGNCVPTIGFVEVIPDLTPAESATNTTTFNFTVTDDDGGSNIDVNTAAGYFQRSGEATRSNLTCSDWATSGDDVNFTCTIGLLYFDQAGAWTINVTVRDNHGATAENSSTTFTYNLLTAMVIAPTALAWGEIGLTAADTPATSNPVTVNNTGNDVNLSINVTAIDLRGNVTLTDFIFAENFTVENITTGCDLTFATTMVNKTSTNVTSTILHRGNNTLQYNNFTSGQEQVFFCLKGVPQNIASQEYSSIHLGVWTVQIIT